MRVKRSGVEEMSLTTNMGRLIRRVNTGGSNGSITDDGLLTGVPDWVVVPFGDTGLNSGFLTTPTISVSGNVLSWVYPTSVNGFVMSNAPAYILVFVR